METTTFEKIGKNEYFVTIYPQSFIDEMYGDMFDDMLLEYTIKIENNFVSEIRFAIQIASFSRDIGQQIVIDESEFTKRVF
jgi:hypothetical protein